MQKLLLVFLFNITLSFPLFTFPRFFPSSRQAERRKNSIKLSPLIGGDWKVKWHVQTSDRSRLLIERNSYRESLWRETCFTCKIVNSCVLLSLWIIYRDLHYQTSILAHSLTLHSKSYKKNSCIRDVQNVNSLASWTRGSFNLFSSRRCLDPPHGIRIIPAYGSTWLTLLLSDKKRLIGKDLVILLACFKRH